MVGSKQIHKWLMLLKFLSSFIDLATEVSSFTSLGVNIFLPRKFITLGRNVAATYQNFFRSVWPRQVSTRAVIFIFLFSCARLANEQSEMYLSECVNLHLIVRFERTAPFEIFHMQMLGTYFYFMLEIYCSSVTFCQLAEYKAAVKSNYFKKILLLYYCVCKEFLLKAKITFKTYFVIAVIKWTVCHK